MFPRASLSVRRHFRIEGPHWLQRGVDTTRPVPERPYARGYSFVLQSYSSAAHLPSLLLKSSFLVKGLSTQLKSAVDLLRRSLVSADLSATTEGIEMDKLRGNVEPNQVVDNHGNVDEPTSLTETNCDVEDDAIVIDDPCWGSPTNCSLLNLLKLIKKHDVILYESADYIVLRKPADLRMDGDYPATVHKLLTFWYPPPSLTNRSLMNISNPSELLESCDPPSNPENFVPSPYTPQQLRLIERIATIPRHCDIVDNELRPCHQLDYATSGVLLVARSKETASRARNAFEKRWVRKAYTAILLGHVEIPQKDSYFNEQTIEAYGGDAVHSDHSWSNVTHRALNATMEQMEYKYRKARQRHDKKTFHGFVPARNIFIRWQDRQRLKFISSRKSSQKHKKDFTAWNKKHSIKWDTIFAEVDALSELVKGPITKIIWEDLKNSESDLDSAIVKKFERAADKYNDDIRENLAAQKQKERLLSEALPTLPTFFRVKEDPQTDANSFYIFAPLAQDDVTNNFAMLIHPSHSHLCPHLQVGDPSKHDFKPSLTSCTILYRTYVRSSIGNTIEEQKIPVTVVKMEPKTGRRHQLRIHAALLGHPIAGDATYCRSETKERTVVDRLCLHSFSLKVPQILPNGMDLEIQSESPFRVRQDEDTSFVTIDPF
jgi:23S rRNA-/tRNA-specific pseudouridylate synthase